MKKIRRFFKHAAARIQAMCIVMTSREYGVIAITRRRVGVFSDMEQERNKALSETAWDMAIDIARKAGKLEG